MVTVTVQEMTRDLRAVLRQVEDGEDVLVVDGDKAIAQVSLPTTHKKPRRPGSARGKVWMSPDFDAPLSEDELKEFG